MQLVDFVKQHASEPSRTWPVGLSKYWYDRNDFWAEMITDDKIYTQAMIETEAGIIDQVSRDYKGTFKNGYFVALGPGDSEKESRLHSAIGTDVFVPIDINEHELLLASQKVKGKVQPLHCEFKEGLDQVKQLQPKFMYLGNTFSNLAAFEYDLLEAIKDTMGAQDQLYLSVQTLPSVKDLPLLLQQYTTARLFQVNAGIAHDIGVTPGEPFVQYNPVNEHIEIGSTVISAEGAAEEMGIRPKDKIITMMSHKPKSLEPILSSKLTGYSYDLYRAERPVSTPLGNYTSTFEAAVLHKV